MTDETNVSDGVNEEVASLQPDNTAPAQTTAKEYNFRQLERGKLEAENRARELELKLHEIERLKSIEPDEFDSLKDDDYLEAKHIKKLRKEIQELKSQKNPGIDPQDLMRLKLRDYDDVVSDENVTAHLLSNPALEQMVRNAANPYEAAYHLLKKLTAKDAPKSPPASAKKLDDALAKPRSLNEASAKVSGLSSGQSSMAEIEGRRAEALKRAERYLGGFY